MPAKPAPTTVTAHLRGKEPNVAATHAELLRAARTLGPVRVEVKKTSIHWCRATAFAGIATQRAALILTLKSATDIGSPRIRKSEQASANRWHVEIRLASPRELDAELRGWIAAAYQLAG